MSKKLEKTIKRDEFGVTVIDGIPVVSSRKIAEIFDKRHADVIRSIDNVECSLEFRERNFALSNYKSGKREYKEYLLTKDGFAFVVMGFTGKKAAEFKESYISRFNEMQKFIEDRYIARIEYPELTAMIAQSHLNPKFFHYSNEADMINRIVLGMTSKQFKITHGISKSESIRDYMTQWQIESIQKLQKADVALVVAIPDIKERKKILTQYYSTLYKSLQLPQSS
jgi:Rha family phage regulatory protein